MNNPNFSNSHVSMMSNPAFQTSVAKAKEICPERLEVRRTAKSLDSEINRLKVKISTQREQQGDREEVVRYVTLTAVIVNSETAVKQLSWGFTFSLTCLFPTFRQYHEALENYKNMAQQMKNLNSFIKSLDSVMNHRLQVYADLRRQVVTTAHGFH